MVTDLGERLEVARDGAREISQGPAKKANQETQIRIK